jgi:hypothetical protein
MNRKLALKRLTISDLGLFKSHYDQNTQPDGTQKGGKQKSINLNVNPFVTSLYPALPSVTEIKVGLEVYGPGLVNKPHKVNRAIRKSSGSKNWRLNGEWIRDPDSSEGFEARYHHLAEGDLILMEFFGDQVEPRKIRVLLISQSEPEDRGLFSVLDAYLQNRKMIALEDRELRGIVAGIPDLNTQHPLQTFLPDEEELEAAATGAALDFGSPGEDAVSDFNADAPASLRNISTETLKKARESAEQNGFLGEGFVNEYFEDCDDCREHEWSSGLNAVSPYDFKLTKPDGSQEFIEVKSTTAGFGAKIHISLNEVRQAASAPGKYLLYRVYEINEDGAKLRISGNIKDFAKKLLAGVKGFPPGVLPDGFTLSLNSLGNELEFGKEIHLAVKDD